jgi:hypothetical protein
MDLIALIKKARNLYYGKPNKPAELRERTDAERIHLLRKFIVKQVANGATIEIQDDFSAVLVWGKNPNHILHLLLSIVTLGFWLIVWIIIAMSSGEKRTLYKIDKFGYIRS